MVRFLFVSSLLGAFLCYLVIQLWPGAGVFRWPAPGMDWGNSVVFIWQTGVAGSPSSGKGKGASGTKKAKKKAKAKGTKKDQNQPAKTVHSEGLFRLPIPPLLKRIPFVPNVAGANKNLYFFDFESEQAFRISKTDGFYYTQAPFGNAFLRYQKYAPDMKIEFFSHRGRKFWELPDHSYPIMNGSGDLNLFLSSNNYKVHFVNKDGSYLHTVEGPFITDYTGTTHLARPSTEGGRPQKSDFAAVSFLGGTAVVVGGDGKPVFELDNPGMQFKSLALSPNGEYFLLHGTPVDKPDRDFITMYRVEPQKDDEDGGRVPAGAESEVYTRDIGRAHPYKLYMAVNNSGESVVNLPDGAFLLNDSGRPVIRLAGAAERSPDGRPEIKVEGVKLIQSPGDWDEQRIAAAVRPVQGVYHPVATNGRLFVTGRGRTAAVVGRDGMLLLTLKKIRPNRPWRFIFAPDGRVLCVENGGVLRYYGISDGDPTG